MLTNLKYWFCFVFVIVILTITRYVLYNLSGEAAIESHIKVMPDKLNAADITYTIKTTEHLHNRLDVLLKTWVAQVPQYTYIITDTFDGELSSKVEDGHLIVAEDCEKDHSGRGLSCKLGREFDVYMKSPTKWWCHFDDDNYVNVRRLVDFLDMFDPGQPWYVGRQSVKDGLDVHFNETDFRTHFAHGGCGFCLSRAMTVLIEPFMREYMTATGGELPNDDVMVGIFITHILGRHVTSSELFNSHYHASYLVGLETPERISQQISLSYDDSESNVHVTFDHEQAFSEEADPTRFLSVHCWNYPRTNYCRRNFS